MSVGNNPQLLFAQKLLKGGVGANVDDGVMKSEESYNFNDNDVIMEEESINSRKNLQTTTN